MLDLTVLSIPVYLGTMEAERRYLRVRAADRGPSAGDYEPRDTATSLLMGVGSLLGPLVAPRLLRQVAPGEGRHWKLLVGGAAAAGVVTTVADRVADREPARTRRGRLARRIRRITGPVAVGATTVAVSTFVASRTSAARQWRRSRDRDLGTGAVAWLTAIAGWDLIYYWNHRLMHEVRGMWAIHVVHHSSERYNLSTALRQPVAEMFGVFLPYGLMARFGVRPALIVQARAVNLLYQYWIHTETIRSIGPAERVLNSASHHRVHHGSNPQYLDRNHGSILIVWDKLFGTFEPEDEPVVYGLTKNIDSFNPVVVAGHEYRDILRDVADSENWRDRLSFVLRGPGWAYARHRERAELEPETAGRA